ncbi:type VI secretion system Vgr family protein [Caldimonas brevitalea]|uniref:Uncharacterized protein n=1 Tax=Caldimonas brevitalea TaxID=413882 RepID=A0A0G3BMP5_9BURK|nr:type VI secretion system tip protein TssI/VgrG [Caldimonas brevitalea]AKJ30734.1 hypothetical protein AAW51_4043 [Caldimonas brevitalea]
MTDMSEASQAILALLANPQHKRMVRMEFPRGDAPQAKMLANKFDGYESVSRDFHFVVEVLSDNARIPLKDVLGKMVTVELVREDGSLRYFNGFVFEFRFVRTDGAFAFYDMVLMPWLAFLRLRKDNYLFHGKTVEEQIDEIFKDYPEHDWRYEAEGEDRPMTDACQFDESDYNYVHRRLEERGLYYAYEHRKDGHTLVVRSNSTLCPPIDGATCEIAWQSESGSLDDDAIADFTPVRRIASTTVSASSFDFKDPRPKFAEVPTVNKQGQVPPLEVYEYTGAYGFATQDQGQAHVRRRMEEIEAAAKHFQASGNDRTAQAGRWFRLTGHFDTDLLGSSDPDQEFFIIQAQHTAQNNYEQARGTPSEYSNRFVCLRKKIPWRPGLGFNSYQPKIDAQTAIVVGPKGEEIYTDQYGRVKVQFHWDRVGNYDEKSSAWIRVSSAWTGDGYGFIGIPRIGQEVLVIFLDGNPDRPLITSCLFNEHNQPAWGYPEAAHQTGIQSRSTPGGNGFCEIVIHDRAGHELINIHSQKDMVTTVQHNKATIVNGPMQTIDVTKGYQETKVKQHIKVESLDDEIEIVAATKITLRCGASTIVMDKDGNIDIQGKVIRSVATDDHTVKGSKLHLNPPG